MHKSLLSSTLTLVFAIVAYATYVFALLGQHTAWMIVSAVLYFFPVFTEFFDELPGIRVGKKWQLVGLVVCVICAIFCLVSMLVFLTLASEESVHVHIVFKWVMAMLPVTCIPVKAIPFIQALYQWCNRNTDSPKKP